MQLATKRKVKDLVSQYIKHFPEEYHLTVQYLKDNRKLLANDLADLTKQTDFIERAMFEIPETLDNIFRMRLKDDERKELETKDGARWFMRQFEEFKVPEKI